MPNFNLYGVALICGALVADAFIGNVQARLCARRGDRARLLPAASPWVRVKRGEGVMAPSKKRWAAIASAAMGGYRISSDGRLSHRQRWAAG